MAWFADLSPCDYFGAEFVDCLRAVGWLERGQPFPIGPVDPAVYARLAPEDFCRAVLTCPPMRSMPYLKALLAAARSLVQAASAERGAAPW
jgi:hypothetical protein